jgi:hypothetical protein
MRNITFFILTVLTLSVISCSKSSSTDNTPPGTEFKFTSLVVQDTAMAVNGVTNVTASASGSGLSYHWTASYGTFIGSGSSVKWTVCHADTFTITCEVNDDQGHSDSKTVSVNVH